MAWWVWLVAGLLLLGLELLTAGAFFFIFLAAGAVVVGMVMATGADFPLWLQVALFSAFSVTTMVLFRRQLKARVIGRDRGEVDVDSLVGEAGVVVQDMPPGGLGKVELRGSFWNARNDASSTLARGSRCRVTAVEGITVRVRPDAGD